MTGKEKLVDNNHNGGKYLTFYLGNVEYAIEILKIVEIFGYIQPTVLPQTPKYIPGLINLRGKILPIMNLREKLGLENEKNYTAKAIIQIQGNNIDMGIVVDRLSKEVNIHAENIDKTPYLGENINRECILGIDKTKNMSRFY